MANWTIKFTDRTDGVIMLGDISVPNMKPIPEAGININTAFTTAYCFYTSDNEFTVNNNAFTVQNDDNGLKDGGATITATKWTPNSKQMDIIRKIPETKKYRYFFTV